MMDQTLKPREKALRYGMKSLTDDELMAIIFGTGTRGENVFDMCRNILRHHGGHVSKIAQTQPADFVKQHRGIGPAKALTLLAGIELGLRAAADAIKLQDPPIDNARIAYEYMKPHLDGLDHEEFWVLLLRQNLTPIGEFRIGQGGLSATVVDIKILMRYALTYSASAMMIFHNHPSGGIKPSGQDTSLTHRIVEAAKLFDIRVIDHIIIGRGKYYSYHDQGII